MIKRIVVFVFLSSIVLQLGAQGLKIVKDNINCAYGLKDDKGDWILEAKYTLIQTTNTGFYLLLLDGQQGIANRTGKVLIAPTYDFIEAFPPQLSGSWHLGAQLDIPEEVATINHQFRVSKGAYKGLINQRGKVLFLVEYEQIEVDRLSEVILYKRRGNQYISTFADTSGQIIIGKVMGFLGKFDGNPMAIVADEYTLQKNPWVIDRNGKTIIDKGNEKLYFDQKHQRIIAVNNRIRTDFDVKGNRLPKLVEQKPKYQLYRRSWNGSESLTDLNHALRNHTQVIIDGSRNFGLYRNGEVSLETAYSFIDDEDPGSKNFEFIVGKSGKWGTASFIGELTIPVEYDTLIPQQLLWGNDVHSESQRYSFIAAKNGKYGLVGEKEEVFESLENDHYLGNMGRYGTRFAYFSKSIKVKGYDLNTYPPLQKQINFVARHDSLVLFKQDELILPFVVHPNRSYQLYKSVKAEYYGTLCAFHLGDKSYLAQPDGSLFMKEKLMSYRQLNNEFLVVQTQSGLSGLIDVKSRKFVIAPIYKEFDHRFSNHRGIWARKEGPYLPKQGYGCGHWYLLGLDGEPLSDKAFSKPFPLSNEHVFTSVDGLAGLMDVKTFQWILDPVFADFIKLRDSFWLSMTPTGKMGLIKENGQLIEDTLYDHIVQVYQAGYLAKAEFWFELRNGDQNRLVNDQGVKVIDQSVISEMKQMFAFYPLGKDDGAGYRWGQGYNRNACLGCLHIGIDSALWTTFESEPFRKDIYEIATEIFSHYQPCLTGPKNNIHCTQTKFNCRSVGQLKSFQVDYINKQGFSLLDWYTVNTDGLGMPVIPYYRLVKKWSNYLSMGGKLQKVRRTDIFGEGNLLYNEFKTAISSRDDLDLTCGTVSEIEMAVGEQFSFSEKGVLLHIGKGFSSRGEAQVLIPWENLLKHPESVEIASLFR